MQYFKTLQCCKPETAFLDAPVRIEEAAILQEPFGRNVFGRVRLASQTQKNIIAVIIRLSAYNVAKEELDLEEPRYIYQDMVIAPRETYGEDEPLPLPRDARQLDVVLEKAVLEDGTVWEASPEDEVSLLPQDDIAIPDQYLHKFQERIAGRFANLKALGAYYVEGDRFWQCTCRTAVSESNEVCPCCGNERAAQKEFLSEEGLAEVLSSIEEELQDEESAALADGMEKDVEQPAGADVDEERRQLEEERTRLSEEAEKLQTERQELSDARASLEQAQLEFSGTKASLEQAQNELSETRANLEQAQLELSDRLRQLESDRKQLEEERAELEKAKEHLSYEKSQLDKAKALVAKQAAVVLHKGSDERTVVSGAEASETGAGDISQPGARDIPQADAGESAGDETRIESVDFKLENAFSRQIDASQAWMKEETDRSGEWETPPEEEYEGFSDDEEEYDEDFAGNDRQEASPEDGRAAAPADRNADQTDLDEDDLEDEDFEDEDFDDEDLDSYDDLDDEDEDDEDGHRKSPRKDRGRVLRGIVTVMFLGAAVSAGYFGFQYYQQQTALRSQYEEAVELMNVGSYDEAIQKFYELGNYKDSSVMCNRLIEEKNQRTYDEAYELYENGGYEEAISLWDSLGTFKNSEEMIKEAQKALDAKQEEEQAALPSETGGEEVMLEDGVSGTDQEVYDEAYAAYQRGDYQLAIEMWDAVKDFKDSAQMIEIAATEWLMSESGEESGGDLVSETETAPLIEETF